MHRAARAEHCFLGSLALALNVSASRVVVGGWNSTRASCSRQLWLVVAPGGSCRGGRQWHAATNQHIAPGAPPLDPRQQPTLLLLLTLLLRADDI